MQVIINPGTGTVANANLIEATKNVDVLLKDADLDGWSIKHDADMDEKGRFAFNVQSPDGSKEIEIDMPGVPLDEVRFTGAVNQNIWNFPRLYVGGSSWVWKYAVNVLKSHWDEDED